MDQPDDGRTDGAGIRSERWLWRIASRLQSEVHVRGGVHSFSKLSVLRGRTEFCAGRQQGESEVQEMGCTRSTNGPENLAKNLGENRGECRAGGNLSERLVPQTGPPRPVYAVG